ncbi:MAG: SOS cell division inhibitor [Pseudomonadota bacterium]|nr:SOS cell division inhibitor [Pseudomonadota bacterium]
MSEALDALDQLTVRLEDALAREDWEQLGELNNRVGETVEPVMQALEQRQLAAVDVQRRLQQLQRFCSEADARAREVREEASRALKSVNKNNSAARAYRNVSSDKAE